MPNEKFRFVAIKDRLESSHGGVAIFAKPDVDASELPQRLLPCNYQLNKSKVHEIKFGDIAVI